MNDNPFFATGQLVCRIVGTVFFDLKVKGIHHIPRTGGALIVSNHQSYLDPGLIGSQAPRADELSGKIGVVFHAVHGVALSEAVPHFRCGKARGISARCARRSAAVRKARRWCCFPRGAHRRMGAATGATGRRADRAEGGRSSDSMRDRRVLRGVAKIAEAAKAQPDSHSIRPADAPGESKIVGDREGD